MFAPHRDDFIAVFRKNMFDNNEWDKYKKDMVW